MNRTTTVRLEPDPSKKESSAASGFSRTSDDQLRPWQFFVIAALGCATAGVFIARGQGIVPVILLTILMGTAALAGLAALRTLRPLVSPADDRTSMIGHRTRAALEREKMLALRAIKELEFDRAMGKLSDADWQEMSGRLRARATRLMRQLDAGAGYRERIERDLARRLGDDARPKPSRDDEDADARLNPSRYNDASRDDEVSRDNEVSLDNEVADSSAPGPKGPGLPHDRDIDTRRAGPSASARPEDERASARLAEAPEARRRLDPPICDACGKENDADARFCKSCGNKL